MKKYAVLVAALIAVAAAGACQKNEPTFAAPATAAPATPAAPTAEASQPADQAAPASAEPGKK